MRRIFLTFFILILSGSQIANALSVPIIPLTDFKRISECYALTQKEFINFAKNEIDKEKVEIRFYEMENNYLECASNTLSIPSPILHSNGTPAIASGQQLKDYLVYKELAKLAYEIDLHPRSKLYLVKAFEEIELLFPEHLKSERKIIGSWGVYPFSINYIGHRQRLPVNFKELLVRDFINLAILLDLNNLADATKKEFLPIAIKEKLASISNLDPLVPANDVDANWVAEPYQ